MTKGAKITLFAVAGAGVIGYLYWQSKKNEEEAKLILEYISQSVSQVDKNAAADQGIKTVENTKFDPKKMHLIGTNGKDLFGDIKNPVIKDAMAKVVVDLRNSMKGAGTNKELFYKAFMRIRNKNTMGIINSAYKGLYGETLFEAMKGESDLNSAAYAIFSDKTKYDLMIPGLSEGKWAPPIADYLSRISLYN